MKYPRITPLILGALSLAAVALGAVGCKDTTGVETDATEQSLYTIYTVDAAVVGSPEQLPTYDEVLAGALLTNDDGQILSSLEDGPKQADGHHGRHGHGRGRGHNGDDSNNCKRDDSTVNVHNIETLLGSLPGMTDSLRLLLDPCFESYRSTVIRLKQDYNTVRRTLRTSFNNDVRALLADTSLTDDQKRARFDELKASYQSAAQELKQGLHTEMKAAVDSLVECISGYLNDEQLAAFREGLAQLMG